MYFCKAGHLTAVRKCRGKSGHHSAVYRVTPVVRLADRTSATERKYSSAVVKSGKLYTVKRQVNQCLKEALLSWWVGG